jgi:hypothetical protein
MHYKYVHFGGGESMKDLLKAKGIIKDEKESVNILQPKTCPHCREPNRPDAQFCFKCNFVMSFDAYHKGVEERDRKDEEIHELKEQMNKMQQDYKSYDEMVKEVLEKVKEEKERQKKEEKERNTMYDILDKMSPDWRDPYINSFRTPPHELRKKVEEFLEKIKTLPDDDD